MCAESQVASRLGHMHSLERDGRRVLDARVAFIRPYVSHIKAEDALETYVSFVVLCKYVV